LTQRLKEHPDFSYDRAERAALTWAIGELTAKYFPDEVEPTPRRKPKTVDDLPPAKALKKLTRLAALTLDGKISSNDIAAACHAANNGLGKLAGESKEAGG
jgi:hypothetical protein